MKKSLLVLSLIIILLLCACTNISPTDGGTTNSTANETPSATETTINETLPSTESTSQVTEPSEVAHSRFYVPGYMPRRILQYFEEVVLNMEYTDNSGNAKLIQKWTAPIQYRILGTPTDEDLSVLNTFFSQLNEIPGFPGISAAADGVQENLSIHFLAPGAFKDMFSAAVHGEDAYGAAQFWYYTDSNEIHSARIGYRTDIDQASRKSVLLEEIVNCLGISDSELRRDSIVYQHSNENATLSDVDWSIIKLLYDPAFECGMNAENCTAIFNVLYY